MKRRNLFPALGLLLGGAAVSMGAPSAAVPAGRKAGPRECHCCEPGCGNVAEWEIRNAPYGPDDYTHACSAHVGVLLGDGLHTVYALPSPLLDPGHEFVFLAGEVDGALTHQVTCATLDEALLASVHYEQTRPTELGDYTWWKVQSRFTGEVLAGAKVLVTA
jgi:hypothetical protein